MDQPIISICIPTYNRSSTLNKLFENLAEIKSLHGELVEICVSNNQSTDNTVEIIDNWSATLKLKVITQSRNIGATMNVIEVVKLSSGKWSLVIGDDDLFITDAFSLLLKQLSFSKKENWTLVGVLNELNGMNLLEDLTNGKYNSMNFKQTILRTGLYRYGFIGMHAFPSSLKDELSNLSFEEAQPWPHLALLLNFVQKGTIDVFDFPVVKQAGGGGVLFWKIEDMLYIKLRKLNVIAAARSRAKTNLWFYDLLILRELYLARDIRTLIFWKILNTSNFNKKSLSEYLQRYKLLRATYIPLAFLHAFLLLTLNVLPAFIIRNLMNVIGQKVVLSEYEKKAKVLTEYDGVKRGV